MVADRVGRRLGNYRLTHLLGRGGYAEVYLGEHLRLGTRAAIKVLHTHLAGTEADNFLTEARTIASLEHPHIIRILDFDVQDGLPFLVMAYALNGSLRSHHARGQRLPLPTVVAYVQQIAAALQYAHDHRIIHRDIKPENMLVGRDGEIYLSDFGIALLDQSSRMQPIQNVVGTAVYIAPEQLQGKPRCASDQYSLGIVVYEWLTGELPFRGTLLELYNQHLSAPPPSLRSFIPALPTQLNTVLQTALAKDPTQRFESVTAFAAALEHACQTSASILVGKLTSRLEALVPPSNVWEETFPPPANFSVVAPVLPAPLITPPRAVPIGRRLLSVSTSSLRTGAEHLSALPPSAPSLPQDLRQPVSRRAALLGISTMLAGGTGWWLFARSCQPAPTAIVLEQPEKNRGAGAQEDLPLTTVLARDTFQRADQTFWGAASDGSSWEGDANRQRAFSITNASGRIAGGKGTLNALLGPMSRDTEILVSAAISSFANDTNFGVVLRWSNNDNWYKAQLDGKHLSILRCINGRTDVLKTLPLVVQPERPYKLRFRTIGVVLLAKAWPAKQDEPADWQITASDNVLISGRAGLRVVLQTTTIMTITSFIATDSVLNNASTL
ncbi:MAG: serine/threonine protein kinase [Ktedonobacteraceae bacterium]|nr:serine/threonine protein kinase [Ktedonobacteraceae bacterium]